MTSPTTFNFTLAQIERRLAVLHQERRFRPDDPWLVLFTKEEISMMFKEPADGSR